MAAHSSAGFSVSCRLDSLKDAKPATGDGQTAWLDVQGHDADDLQLAAIQSAQTPKQDVTVQALLA